MKNLNNKGKHTCTNHQHMATFKLKATTTMSNKKSSLGELFKYYCLLLITSA